MSSFSWCCSTKPTFLVDLVLASTNMDSKQKDIEGSKTGHKGADEIKNEINKLRRRMVDVSYAQ